MILCIEDSKDTTKKLLELINEFSKVAGYKLSIQQSVVFLYTNNELSKKQIKKTISFAIMSERVNYLKINPTKEAEEK